ncbi:MFS transporter [Paenibacillus soyae]|uniref:MFS transporter n=1 Tax=Paenibacillus soyae TaxID=2969249 RepID=A0A9X2MZI9_9BACL|nr:MFS transporter [Paenibacillus soyae]MCR2806412.1 MFS transporter [Paenibacillus soyae]
MKPVLSEQSGEKLLRVMLFTLMLSSMSALMFNIVLPGISEEFGLTMAEVSWMSSSYSLIYAVGTVTYGKLSDRFKLKNIITFGLLLFAAGSLLGLFSQSFGMALAARVLQSAGAASIPAISMLIPIRYFPAERRGAALGVAAVGLALGSALGPVLSALLTSFADWRWLFCFPLALLIMIPFYRRYLGDEQPVSGARFDWLGGLLLGVSAGLVLIGFTNGSWAYLLAGAATGLLFIWRIRGTEDPFVRPELFRNSRYAMMLVIAVFVNGIGVSLFFLTPILLASEQGLPPYLIGFAMVPAAAASALLGRKAGRLADKRGNAFLYTIAALLLSACMLLLSSFLSAPAWFISAFLVLGNVGQSFMMITLSNTVSRTLPKEQVGVGMGLFSMCGFITHGMASGIYGIVADWKSEAAWNPIYGSGGGAVLSNLYLVLAALHVCVLAFYLLKFGGVSKLNVQTPGRTNAK